MSELQIFENEQFGKIRVVEKDGSPWFVVSDVCEYFGVTNRNRVMQDIDENEKGGTRMITPGGEQTVAIVSEAGLYDLLFALRPTEARGVSKEYIAKRIEKLRRFKRWVTSEVLPAIRKTGGYSTLAQRKAELAALMKEQDGKISKYAMGKLALMAAQLITGLPVPGTQRNEANKLEHEGVKDAVARYMEAAWPSERRPVRVSCAALYERFKVWCRANGCEPCGRGLFFSQLTAQGFGSRRRLYRSPITGEVTRGYDLA